MSSVARYNLTDDGGKKVLRLSGDLTLPWLGVLPTRLDRLKEGNLTLDMSDVGNLDTIGAWLVYRTARDTKGEIVGATKEHRSLIDKVAQYDEPVQVRPEAPPPMARVLGQIGHAVSQAGATMFGLLGFFGALLIATWKVIRSPRRFRVNAVVQRFEIVGVHALGIIGLMSFLVGIVIAQQGAVQLRQFGAEVFTINLVGRSAIKELGVLMTAIMVAGRSGSAFAAQIGSMKLAEEVDAMRTIGVSPMEALVLPRVTAVVLMMPLLGFYAALCAILGGALFCMVSLEIPLITFIQRTREVVPMTDVWQCLIKAPVFGLIIGMAGCYQGLQVESNAEEVGQRTTTAVVQAIFLVIVLDAFFAIFFTAGIGWA